MSSVFVRAFGLHPAGPRRPTGGAREGLAERHRDDGTLEGRGELRRGELEVACVAPCWTTYMLLDAARLDDVTSSIGVASMLVMCRRHASQVAKESKTESQKSGSLPLIAGRCC